MKKLTQGRQKIEMKRIEKNNNRQVTFSKRRNGLFKKAAEISVLTGADVAVVVESPGGRVYGFSNLSGNEVMDRFLNGESGSKTKLDQQENPHPLPMQEKPQIPSMLKLQQQEKPNIPMQKRKKVKPVKLETQENLTPTAQESIRRYNKVCDELEGEKQRGLEIEQSKKLKSVNVEPWWNQPIDHLGKEELEEYIAALEKLIMNVNIRADELRMMKTSANQDYYGFVRGFQ